MPAALSLVRDLVRRGGIPPLLVFATHVVLAKGLGAYDRFPWLDVPVHTAGGVAIAFFSARALDLFGERGWLGETVPAVRALFVLALTALAAVLWELAEVALRAAGIAPPMIGPGDAVADLFFGLAGGCIWLLLERARLTGGGS